MLLLDNQALESRAKIIILQSEIAFFWKNNQESDKNLKTDI